MNSMPLQSVERESHRAQASREELVELIARAIREDGTVEPLRGLHFNRASSPREPLHSVYDPVFCVIAQGSKEIFLNNERYVYDSCHYLLVTAELPLVGHVLDASKERPYLSLRLDLDPTLVSSRAEVHRPAVGHAEAHGEQGAGAGGGRAGRPAAAARRPRRPEGRRRRRPGGPGDRLPHHPEGARGRRRARDEDRPGGRRRPHRLRDRLGRGPVGLRQRRHVPGALRGGAAPHRAADRGRRAREHHPPRRARVLGAAPPPEAHRGGPQPGVSPELRREMGEVVLGAMRKIAYNNVGTIEFLMDEKRQFYFLEVNTRLQVEHPITEMVTGLDLVAEQLRVAEGDELSFGDTPPEPRGWSMEARIIAEDPARNFMPSLGRIERVRFPQGPGVRNDSGIYRGYEVPVFYDSLLAKLVVQGMVKRR